MDNATQVYYYPDLPLLLIYLLYYSAAIIVTGPLSYTTLLTLPLLLILIAHRANDSFTTESDLTFVKSNFKVISFMYGVSVLLSYNVPVLLFGHYMNRIMYAISVPYCTEYILLINYVCTCYLY